MERDEITKYPDYSEQQKTRQKIWGEVWGITQGADWGQGEKTGWVRE